MKDRSLQSKLLFGALVGALIGLAVGWMMANRSQPESHASDNKPKKPITLSEVIGLGFALMKVARQASDVARKI